MYSPLVLPDSKFTHLSNEDTSGLLYPNKFYCHWPSVIEGLMLNTVPWPLNNHDCYRGSNKITGQSKHITWLGSSEVAISSSGRRY